MKKKRALPYGYTIRDGRRIVDTTEAKAIRQIYEAYQNGATMRELAATMTKLKIPYCEKRVDWNKNLIARILSNPQYIGADGFEPIIDSAIFREVNQSIQQRTKRQEINSASAIGVIRARCKCGKCGSRMIRYNEKRSCSSVFWRCENQECKERVSISDDLLEKRIAEQLNTIIENPDLLENDTFYEIDDSEIPSRTTEMTLLSVMCESGNYSDEQLLDRIMKNAAKRYEKCPSQSSMEATIVGTAFENAEPSDELDTELFLKTVRSVLLEQNGIPRLLLITGKEI